MADSPQRRQQSYQQSGESSSTASEMAMLTAAPTAHTGFRKEYPWDAAPIPSLPPLPSLASLASAPSHSAPALSPQLSHESSRVVLPPIRSAIPGLLEKPLESAPHSAETSPRPTSYGGSLTSPSYVHSSTLGHKRKREGGHEEDELDRARQIPRLHPGFESTIPPPPPSPPRHRPVETWPTQVHPSRMSPLSRGSVHERQDVRAPPPPPPMTTRSPVMAPHERGHSSVRPSTKDRYADGYRDYAPAAVAPPPSSLPPPPHRYGPPSSAYDYPRYRHHSHLPALNTATAQPASPPYQPHGYEPTPFSAGPYPCYHDARYRDINGMSLGDGKGPRKRRGNLPKETTDKLRAWFVAHLTHPYPTEDEKQELMRQTGLQMNQISNWFINARRRQLPTMINNARVETDATSGRASEGAVLPSTERHEMHHGSSRSLTLSDGEGPSHGLYDEEGDSFTGQRNAIKRGSV